MHFLGKQGSLEYCGQVIYRQSEWSFDFEPGQVSHCSILLQGLHLSFQIGTWQACQVWGFHPSTCWEHKPLLLPPSQTGSLVLLNDLDEEETRIYDDLEEIGAIAMKEAEHWHTIYDQRTGWICLGESKTEKDAISIEFASDTIATVHHQQLTSLWLKPLIETDDSSVA
jgi:hypothetical protein